MEKKIKTKEQKYNEYVKQVTPTTNTFLNIIKAFFVGGLICVVGQFFIQIFENQGMEEEVTNSWVALILILIAVILTGLNIYPKITKFGGAGALVPITGFANAVAAPAIEYKKEGQIFGIGTKIFTIAGPVILYGILSSWVVGLIYYILMQTGIVQ